ncbi:MAG: hypothetical protein N2322_02185 [Terrimicrobiaceae bacterium]|nr:hypothetical protein [Terrimicrobiaceae bacterium]
MRAPPAWELLFAWPSRHALHLGLPVALAASALLHAAALAVFSLREPAAARPSLRPAAAAFLPQGHPAAAPLKIRAAMADPSIFSPLKLEEPAGLEIPGPEYKASFEAWLPVPAPAPPYSPEVPGGVLPLGPVRQAVRRPGTDKTPAPGTSVSLGGGLAGREFQLPGGSRFVLSLRMPPAPSEWLVAVGADGRVAHEFLMRSSGDEALDNAARAALRGGRAHPAPGSTVWGFAAFNWGADLELPPSP